MPRSELIALILRLFAAFIILGVLAFFLFTRLRKPTQFTPSPNASPSNPVSIVTPSPTPTPLSPYGQPYPPYYPEPGPNPTPYSPPDGKQPSPPQQITQYRIIDGAGQEMIIPERDLCRLIINTNGTVYVDPSRPSCGNGLAISPNGKAWAWASNGQAAASAGGSSAYAGF